MRQVGVTMRRFGRSDGRFFFARRLVALRCAGVVWIACIAVQAGAAEIRIDSVTMSPSSTATLNVVWSSTIPLNYLSTEFRITTGLGGVAEQLIFATTGGEPPTPPLSDSRYVFYDDSFNLTQLPEVNPATVSASGAWQDSAYVFSDSTDSFTDYIQDGSRLWTTLEINALGLAAGAYQIVLQSGQYTNEDTPVGSTPTATGGFITVVPEPDSLILCIAGVAGFLWRLHRQRAVHLASGTVG
jgi:hypothetical protein